MKDRTLVFGLSEEVPDGVEAAWGARWIFPDDIVPDRMSWLGCDTPSGRSLKTWLGEGAVLKARVQALTMSRARTLSSSGRETVILHEDAVGKIVGNPRRSFGYLYVAAWLKEALG